MLGKSFQWVWTKLYGNVRRLSVSDYFVFFSFVAAFDCWLLFAAVRLVIGLAFLVRNFYGISGVRFGFSCILHLSWQHVNRFCGSFRRCLPKLRLTASYRSTRFSIFAPSQSTGRSIGTGNVFRTGLYTVPTEVLPELDLHIRSSAFRLLIQKILKHGFCRWFNFMTFSDLIFLYTNEKCLFCSTFGSRSYSYCNF